MMRCFSTFPGVGQDERAWGFFFSVASIVLAAASTNVVLAQSTKTWNQASGTWDTTTANWTGSTWANGDNAVFGGTAGSTITLGTAISTTGIVFNVNNDLITGNTLSFTGGATINTGGNTVTVDSILDGTAGVVVEGGGTVNFGGVSTIRGSAASGNNSGLNVGNASANNTVNIANGGKFSTISANFRSLSIGNSTSGGNVVNISTAGDSTTPSFLFYGNSAQLNMGVSSSNNQLNVSNGAQIFQNSASGTNTWTMGTNANANGNSITVSGNNTVLSRSGAGGSFLNVGSAGDNNTLTVSAGATLNSQRLGVGMNGGDNNVATITGANSLYVGIVSTTGNNGWLEVGAAASSIGNSLRVENGGKVNYSGSVTSTARVFGVGSVATADSNRMRITGVGSSMNANMVLPLGIGTKASNSAISVGGNSNALEVLDGGSFTTVSPIYVGTSVAAGGADSTNNTVSIGNGTTNIAQIVVNASAGQFNTAAGYDGTYTIPGTATPVAVQTSVYTAPGSGALTTQGIFLNGASSTLNINNGRLIAGDSFGSSTQFISGPGSVNLAGPAYFRVPASSLSATISSAISGSGSLTKETAGTLILSGANTYTGDTSVLGGELRLSSAFLADSSSVFLSTGGFLNLAFSGSDTVDKLFFDGVQQAAGTYNATSNPDFFLGSGSLVVTAAVPEPATIALAAVAGLAVVALGRRRQVA